jgi:hypothetical protein
LGIAVDADGDVYVAGLTTIPNGASGILLKYDTGGNLLWQAIYDGGNGGDYFSPVAVDADGNIVVAGATLTSDHGVDYLLAKYDPAGALIWARSANGPGDGDDYSTGMAVDSAGNIYVVGQQTAASGTDVALVKYNSSGDLQWTRTENGSQAGSADFGGGVAVAAAGNVFFTANLANADTGMDLATTAVDASNSPLWQQIFNGAGGNGSDLTPEASWAMANNPAPHIRSVAVGPDDSVYVIGQTQNTTADPFNGVTFKYDATGTRLWTVVFGGEGQASGLNGIVVDTTGTAFVTGGLANVASHAEYLTTMISADGEVLDQQSFTSSADADAGAAAIALDPDGDPVVTGNSADNIYTVKYCLGCVIDNVCYPDGTIPEGEPCLICKVSVSQTAWSNNDGAACDDGLFCNGADTCGGGACSQHAGDPCNADQTCDETNDACAASGDDDATDDDATDDDATDDDAAGDDSGGGDNGGCGC